MNKTRDMPMMTEKYPVCKPRLLYFSMSLAIDHEFRKNFAELIDFFSYPGKQLYIFVVRGIIKTDNYEENNVRCFCICSFKPNSL